MGGGHRQGQGKDTAPPLRTLKARAVNAAHAVFFAFEIRTRHAGSAGATAAAAQEAHGGSASQDT